MSTRAGIRNRLTAPAIVGSALVIPFVILEVVNRPGPFGDFPFVLFGFLWLLAASFTSVWTSIARNRPGRLGLAAGIGFLLFTAWMWASVVVDQMLCFLGVPNCD